MKFALKTLLASSLVAIATLASAQELKIGYVNVECVLREATPAKAAQAKLEVELKRREKEHAEPEQRVRGASEKFDRESPTWTDGELSRRQRDRNDLDRES